MGWKSAEARRAWMREYRRRRYREDPDFRAAVLAIQKRYRENLSGERREHRREQQRRYHETYRARPEYAEQRRAYERRYRAELKRLRAAFAAGQKNQASGNSPAPSPAFSGGPAVRESTAGAAAPVPSPAPPAPPRRSTPAARLFEARREAGRIDCPTRVLTDLDPALVPLAHALVAAADRGVRDRQDKGACHCGPDRHKPGCGFAELVR